MKAVTGPRVLLLLAGFGALIAAVVLWFAEDSNTALIGLCAGLGIILLAWVQFAEEKK